MQIYFMVIEFVIFDNGYQKPSSRMTLVVDLLTQANKTLSMLREIKTDGFLKTEKIRKNNIQRYKSETETN